MCYEVVWLPSLNLLRLSFSDHKKGWELFGWYLMLGAPQMFQFISACFPITVMAVIFHATL
jgi:hypothetical protein